jgi:Glycosyl hydrolase family 45
MHQGGQTGTGGTVSSTGGTTGGVGGTLTSTGGTGTGGLGTGGSVNAGAGGSTGGGSGTGSSSGGNVGTGGTTAGAGGSSACTDTPPPNGSCSDAVSFGWCGQSWLNGACAQTCGTCTGGGSGGSAGVSAGGSSGSGNKGGMGAGGSSGSGAGGSGGFGNNGGVAPPPNISGGSNGWASRYWDCCKPACGWTGNTNGRNPIKSCSESDQTLSDNNATNACQSGGTAYMCWGDAPWAVGDDLAYGFAAASAGNYVCGRCYHIQFDGSTHNGGAQSGSAGLSSKHMIVQIINNGGVAADQFDLLIPGGGVGALNACTAQWGTSDLGAQYGGFLAGCNGDTGCVQQKCQTVFSGKPDLLAGCAWFLGWFNAADNPNFTYTQIACPSDITNKSGLSDPG